MSWLPKAVMKMVIWLNISSLRNYLGPQVVERVPIKSLNEKVLLLINPNSPPNLRHMLTKPNSHIVLSNVLCAQGLPGSL